MWARSALRAANRIRNIGIAAHIDSGKTTVTERILYYTGRIATAHDVKGKDGVGATMDHMELERERGITITSAATTTQWSLGNINIDMNIIDTPGHIDFGIEVERSLKILDGVVLVACAVAGVQAQTVTVMKQMDRHNIGRIVFINKCDRAGASPRDVLSNLQTTFPTRYFSLLQLPIGEADTFSGVKNIIELTRETYEGQQGEIRNIEYIGRSDPEVNEMREKLEDVLADIDEIFAEHYIEHQGNCEAAEIHSAIRRVVGQNIFSPVFLGTAMRNKGVQPLLDAICRYLPSPAEKEIAIIFSKDKDSLRYWRMINTGVIPLSKLSSKEKDIKEKWLSASTEESNNMWYPRELVSKNGSGVVSIGENIWARGIRSSVENPTCIAMLFKVQNLPNHGRLAFIRIYEGSIRKGDTLIQQSTGSRGIIKRLVRVNAANIEDITGKAEAGSIIAIQGLEGFTNGLILGGDLTLSEPELGIGNIDQEDGSFKITDSDRPSKQVPVNIAQMDNLYIPEAVVSYSIKLGKMVEASKLFSALSSYCQEDPSLRVHRDSETDETVIEGMGELHVEVYVERLKREHGIVISLGNPRVHYRDTITDPIDFDFTHKIQSGGRGQFARIVGKIEPIDLEQCGKEEIRKQGKLSRLGDVIFWRSDKGRETWTVGCEFVNECPLATIPVNYITSVVKGLKDIFSKGVDIPYSISNVRVTLTDGATHDVDSSDFSFKTAAENMIKQCWKNTSILEPIMTIDIVVPQRFVSQLVSMLASRRGVVEHTSAGRGDNIVISGKVPLAETFGFSNEIRGATQGAADVSLTFSGYEIAPSNIRLELIKNKVKK